MSKKTILKPLSLLFILFVMMSCNSVKRDYKNLRAGFAIPPDTTKPWLYYYWLSDNISKEGVTKDLEQMAALGIGGAFIGNIGTQMVPYGKTPMLTEEWWQITEHAIREGGRLGVDIGLFNCPGWSQSGGPWISAKQTMRYLNTFSQKVKGPGKQELIFDKPIGPFEDVTLLAIPVNENLKRVSDLNPQLNCPLAKDSLKYAFDGNLTTGFSFRKLNLTDSVINISIKVNQTIQVRSIILFPEKQMFSAHIKLFAINNGTEKLVKKFIFDRTNDMLNVGPVPFAPVAIALENVNADQYRLEFSKINGIVGFNEILLTEEIWLERYMEKTLAKMHQTPFPRWESYEWPRQNEPGAGYAIPSVKDVIRINARIIDNKITWVVPAGTWEIQRIVAMPTGLKNSPASKEATGYEVDKMNESLMQYHFDSYIGKIIKRMPENDRKALKYCIADSYEMGSQNWTDDFEKRFEKRYGYNPMKWLPVFAGKIIGSVEQTNRFLWDVRRMVADAVAYDYVGGLRKAANKAGLKVWLENYGHWGYPGEFLMYGGQSDLVSGEFWNEGELGNIECKSASSCAHTYGKQKVSAESFTCGWRPYLRFPWDLKKRGDWSFTEGVNQVVFHVYIQQPDDKRKPGVNEAFATEFNRHNHWFRNSKSWVDYERRCMFMLQKGKYVADVCYYISEDAPKMTGTRNPEIPKGYSWDYINAEIIKDKVEIKDGRFTLPDGMSYSILVLPQKETMRPELLKKIKTLIEEGGIVIGPKPLKSPSMENYPKCDQEVKVLAKEIWGNCDGIKVKLHKLGKGMIFSGVSVQQALDSAHVIRDIEATDYSDFLWTHRSMNGIEIYFITNQTQKTISVQPSFRVKNARPELWDAVTGTVRELKQYSVKSDQIEIPIKLLPLQSYFVVFVPEDKTPAPDLKAINFPEQKVVLALTNPWQAQFDVSMRGPAKPIILKELKDWTTFSDPNLKYYSGETWYSCTFSADTISTVKPVYLNLGTVKSFANVKLNGKDLGGVWTEPWQVDISKDLVKGKNKLEIKISNTWANRLIGDSKLPEKERKTWTAYNPYTKDSIPKPSGLLGPVTLQK